MIRSRLIVLLLLAGLLVWFFADALFGGGMFVFRDAGHYYYPLLQFVAGQWKAGRAPLWNPYENLGMPLAANATSSAFYPGMLLFVLLPDFAWAYKLYVLGHVLLAAAAAYRLARHWGGSIEGAGAAALSYAFSGNVLFQYCNVVFLVGAAWLPLAMLAADRMLNRGPGASDQGPGARDQGRGTRGQGRVRWAVAFGAVLALMTLGGNAEMAYHAVLLAAMYAAWLWRRKLEDKSVASIDDRKLDRRPLIARIATCRPALLILGAAVGLVLSAVQVLPSVELTRRSGRAPSAMARTIYELPGRLGPDRRPSGGMDASWADGLTCRGLEPGTHHEQVYHFSVGPWRLAEYLWPDFSGRQFPVHRRWLEIIPGEGRIWVPSLYMGLVPLVLALAAVRLRKGSPQESWLSWLVVLSVVASFGWYGLGWLAHEIRVAAGADPSGALAVGAPLGGLYWAMTVLLPGYIYFRYPAKLLVIAALALSLLAARGWDRAFAGPTRRLRGSLLWLGGLSLLAAAAVVVARPFWNRWLAGVPADVMFGPLDKKGAVTDLFVAFLQTALLCGLFWWLLGRAAKGARWTQTAALVLVAVDLAAANGWMVACAPADQWLKRPRLAAVLEQDTARREADQPYRVFRHPIWTPPAWNYRASPTRLAEAMRWDRDTLWPKYNLSASIPVAEVEGTMTPYDYQAFLWAAKRGLSRRGGSGSLPAKGLSAMNAKYVILRGTDLRPDMEPIDLEGTQARDVEDVSLWHNPAHLPRSWIVHDVDVLPPIESDDPHGVWRRTEQVLFEDGGWRNLHQSAVVEGDLKPDDRKGEPGQERCRVVRYEPSCVRIEAELERPGLVVLCDQFYPGWRLEVETVGGSRRPVPILRTNRVMRGAWLPAGRHRLIYRYRPASFLWGAALGGLGWIALAAVGTAMLVRRRWRASRAHNQRAS